MTEPDPADVELVRAFEAHVAAFVYDRLDAGAAPIKLTVLLMRFAVDIARDDPATTYAELNLFADILKEAAERHRS